MRTIRGSIDTRRLSEGTQTFQIQAVGTDGRSSDVEQHQIWIDRTPPRPPSKFRVETYDPAGRTAVVVWREGGDPEGPQGARPAGSLGYDYRLQRNGHWRPWRSVEAGSIEVAGVVPGNVLRLRVREYDGARNSSRLVEASVRVTGREPRPES